MKKPVPVAVVRLGQIVATPNALGKLTQDDILTGIQRHQASHWGDVDEHDRRENELSLKEGFRLLSVYHDRFMASWKATGLRPVSHLVWVKSHCSREGYTRSHHEVGFLLAKGRPPAPIKPLSDVLPWEYTHNELHPNQKPVVGIAPIIEAFSNPGDIVLDPFAGSGTTGVAAHECGRHFILIESVWRHCQTARARLQRS